MADINFAKRIKRARELTGLSLKEAAERLGFQNYQTLSSIEKGDREVKASELSKISKVYYCDVNDLLSDGDDLGEGVRLLWRKSPEEAGRQEIESYIRQRFEQYHLLEQLLGVEQEGKLRRMSASSADVRSNIKIDVLAEEVRKQLDLGSRPALSLKSVMEQVLGAKLLFVEMGDLGSAASTVHDSYGSAVIVNSSEVPWRINFTLAHELFHLITWEAFPPAEMEDNEQLFEDLEKKADRFASTLLLPEVEVRQEVSNKLSDGKLAYADIVDLAREFGVSTKAVLYRMANLKLIPWELAHEVATGDELREIDKQMRRGSPIHKPKSERFIQLAVKCLRKGLLSRGKFAALLEVERPEIDKILEKYGLTDMEGAEFEIMAP